MKKSLLLLVFCQLLLQGKAQNFVGGRGPRSAGLGETGLTQTDAWAGFNNPGALAGVEHFSAGVSSSRIYNISQLGVSSLAVAIPFKDVGTVGLTLDHFNFSSVYVQQRFGFSLGRSFGEKVMVGIQITGQRIDFGAYGNKLVVTGAAGLLLKAQENLQLGVQIYNPWGTQLASFQEERIPSQIRAGGAYNFAENLNGYFEIMANTESDTRLNMGIDYLLKEGFELRAGFRSNPFVSSFGLAFSLKRITVQLSLAYHQYLGSTPQLGIDYVAEN